MTKREINCAFRRPTRSPLVVLGVTFRAVRSIANWRKVGWSRTSLPGMLNWIVIFDFVLAKVDSANTQLTIDMLSRAHDEV